MRPPARPPVPSAIDGYQRLRRGVGAPADATTEAPGVAAGTDAPPRRFLRRVIGAARLAGMVAVLAIIVGASVGLASSGPGDSRQVQAAATTGPAPEPVAVGPTRLARTVRTRVGTPAAQVATLKAPAVASTTMVVAPEEAAAEPKEAAVSPTAPVAAPKVVVAVAPVATAARIRAVTPGAELPLTGDRLTSAFLLAGGLLVLLGMLLQIAGQPLTRSAVPGAAPR